MRLLLLCTVTAALSALALACSKKSEPATENPDTAATQVAAPDVAVPGLPAPDVADPDGVAPDISAEEGVPSEAYPPPKPGDGRLELGIDGDPGYTQTELTPEELAKVQAEGEASPEPAYPEEPSEPPAEGNPSEVSAESGAGGSAYDYRLRDPLYLERERLRRDQLEEASPVDRPAEGELPRGGRRR